MPRRTTIPADRGTIGQRLIRLRKAAGLTQRELAAELGISQRMVAYYERHAETLPAHILPKLIQTLGVSIEEVLGAADETGNVRDAKLWRRFQDVEKLPPKERQQIIKLLDTFIENERLRQAANVAK